MRKYKLVTKCEAVEQTTDIFCNRCGKKINVYPETDLFAGCGVNIDFGYGSVHDGDIHNIHLCDGCSDVVFGSFVWGTKDKVVE